MLFNCIKQSEAGTDYDFSLLQHERFESVALPPGIEPFTAFRGFRSSKAPVQQIRVRDKSGVKMIRSRRIQRAYTRAGPN